MAVSIITGSHGFIGKHLSDRLIFEGHKVVAVDRDLLIDPVALHEWLAKVSPDYVWHLASYGNHYNQQDEREIVATNIIKTSLLLDALKESNIKQFFNFSSSSVYGVQNNAVSETAELLTDTYYGASKVASEYLTFAWGEKYKKKIVNVRPFSVYGEGEADFRFIPTIIRCLLEGETLELSPNAVHDWIYVRDFTSALIRLIDMPTSIRAVNIGTEKQTSNAEVVRLLKKISNKKAKIKKVDGLRSYDSDNWKSHNSLLNMMEWKPKHSLEEGLRKTYDYYQQRAEKKNN